MASGGARRGRRDNGLIAAVYAVAGDVDPRVGEHLLDVLGLRGIAAYLQPASDMHPVTRNTSLPSRPTDRLFVDREHLDTAREYLALLAAETPAAPADQDRVDRTFARIIAGFNDRIDSTHAPWPAAEDVPPGPSPSGPDTGRPGPTGRTRLRDSLAGDPLAGPPLPDALRSPEAPRPDSLGHDSLRDDSLGGDAVTGTLSGGTLSPGTTSPGATSPGGSASAREARREPPDSPRPSDPLQVAADAADQPADRRHREAETEAAGDGRDAPGSATAGPAGRATGDGNDLDRPSLLDALDTFGAELVDDEEEGYTPPPPPPLPRISPITIAAVLAMLAGFVLVFRPEVLPIDNSAAMVFGFFGILAGFVTLIWRLRSGDDEDDDDWDPDDGAVV